MEGRLLVAPVLARMKSECQCTSRLGAGAGASDCCTSRGISERMSEKRVSHKGGCGAACSASKAKPVTVFPKASSLHSVHRRFTDKTGGHHVSRPLYKGQHYVLRFPSALNCDNSLLWSNYRNTSNVGRRT